MQETIGQRIKFLLDHFGLSARKFSREIGVAENNTQNYLPPSSREPGARYLELVLLRFESVSPSWFLTGKGEPFSPGAASTANTAHINNNSGIGINTGTVTLEACQRELEAVKRDATSYQREIELLKGQLEDKNEIITLLRGGYNRPN